MCAISGYFGQLEPRPYLTKALTRMASRGYDSYGYAVLGVAVDEFRALGPPRYAAGGGNLGCVGVGHTRWATTGAATLENAHPVVGGKGEDRVYVVHNGVITNHQELRQQLRADGYEFRTGTDTECLAHLLHLHRSEDRQAWLTAVCLQLKGEYAFAAFHAGTPGVLLVASNGPPLLVSHSGCVASEAAAMAGYADKAFRLKPGVKGVLSSCVLGLFRHAGERESMGDLADEVDVPAEPAGSEGGGTHMWSEICEQPRLLREEHEQPSLPMGGDVDRVVLFGCGSSYHAALLGRLYLEDVAGVPAQAEYATDVAERGLFSTPGTAWVALTQSGETRDTLAALEKVRRPTNEYFPNVSVLTNVETSQAAAADGVEVVPLGCGPELGVAATKTFTIQCARLLEMAAGEPVGFYGLATAIESVLAREFATDAMADAVRPYRNILYLARGLLLPIAMEGALKMKEVAYRHAEAIHSSEMKHGPIALVDDSTLSVFLVSHRDAEYSGLVYTHMEEILARGGKVAAVYDEHSRDRVLSLGVRNGLCLPAVEPLLYPLLVNVVLQVLAYKVAVADGLDVDRPRSLAKCVTVE